MPGRVRVSREIPRAGTLDRDMWVRSIARALLEDMWELEAEHLAQVEQFLCGLLHYLVGRVQDRPEYPRAPSAWRGKAELLPLAGGLLSKQRETVGSDSLAVRNWLTSLNDETDRLKLSPHARKAFSTLIRLPFEDTAKTLEAAEQAIRRELGDGGA